MKKVIGWTLIVVVLLNAAYMMMQISNGHTIGSGIYMAVLLVVFGLGVVLLRLHKRKRRLRDL